MEEQQEQAGGGVGMLEDRNPPLRWPDLVMMQYPGNKTVAIRPTPDVNVHGLVWGRQALDALLRVGGFTLEWSGSHHAFDETRVEIPYCYIAEDRKLVGVGRKPLEIPAPDSVYLRFPPNALLEIATTLVQVPANCQGLVWSDDALRRLRELGMGEGGQWLQNLPKFVQIFSKAPGCYYDSMGRLICYV